MIVVCYRPDPTQIVDEKLKFVEASSSKRRSFSPKVEPFLQQTSGLPQPPCPQAFERSRFCIPRPLRRTVGMLLRRVFEAMSLLAITHLSIPQALAVKCLARRNHFSTVIIM